MNLVLHRCPGLLHKMLLLAALLTSNQLYASSFKIIPLQNQSAEQMIPLIKPLMDPAAVVTGTGYKLIVRASAQQMTIIEDLIAQLDTPIQQLVISVSQDQAIESELNRQGVAGNIQGDHTGVAFGNPAPRGGLTVNAGNNNNRVQLHSKQGQIQNDYRISQTVKVLSGQPALIQIGQSVPVPQQQVIRHGNSVTVTRSTQYNNLNTGFYVTPRLVRQNVTLDISAQRQQPGRYGSASASTQQVSSRVSGSLGEWIKLGSVDEVTNRQSSSRFGKQSASIEDKRSIYVKVDLDNGQANETQRR